VQKTAAKTARRVRIAGTLALRYARARMGRPPIPPRTYVTRHIRFRRPVDAAMRRAALKERRPFNDLVQIIVEDWLLAHGETLPPRTPRQPRKPSR
jgi:hypothetical protein